MVLLRRQDRYLKINSQFPVHRNRSNIPSERQVNLSRSDLPDFRLFLSISRMTYPKSGSGKPARKVKPVRSKLEFLEIHHCRRAIKSTIFFRSDWF